MVEKSYHYNYGPGRNIERTPKMQEVEQSFGIPIDELLKQEYVNKKQASRTIGKMLKIGMTTVNRWLREAGIPVRSQSEAEALLWEDPAKKSTLSEKSHNPQSNEKRSKSLKATLAAHPEIKQKAVKNMAKGRRKKRALHRANLKTSTLEVESY